MGIRKPTGRERHFSPPFTLPRQMIFSPSQNNTPWAPTATDMCATGTCFFQRALPVSRLTAWRTRFSPFHAQPLFDRFVLSQT